MSFNWSNLSIVITGAYGGLGKNLCHQLAEKGARLILCGRDKEALSALKKTLPSSAEQMIGDVSDRVFHERLVQRLENIKSHSHLLINNAATSEVDFLQQHSPNSIKRMINVNLLAPILLCQSLQPWLLKAKNAKIINIGSTFGAIGYPGFSAYCATKFGLRGFSQALNRELSDTAIAVQYLAPRAMETEINNDKVNQLNAVLNNAVDDPQIIARQIIKAIEGHRSEKFFGWPEKFFAKINGLFPSVVSKAIKKDHSIIKQFIKS